MKGRFYAVGIGPGDPELLTVKAIKAIRECQVVAVPVSGGDENVALKIAGKYIDDNKLLYCDMPMIKDKKALAESHEKAAGSIAGILDKGDDVAFLTLGDPAVYCTVMYIHRILNEWGYDTGMIPGVTSFCGAAASLNVSLCERDEILHVIPATYKGSMSGLDGTRVLMKSGKSIMELRDELAAEGAMMVECATMDNEKVYRNIGELKEQSSYFSLVVVPDKNRKE